MTTIPRSVGPQVIANGELKKNDRGEGGLAVRWAGLGGGAGVGVAEVRPERTELGRLLLTGGLKND